MNLNPVERRLVLLNQHWQDFRADTTRRLLVWQVPDNAARLAEGYIEAQKHDHPDYTSGDLFLLFKTPFVYGLRYARDLKEALRGQYDASLSELGQQGLPTDWPFRPEAVPDTAAAFAEAVRSFGSHYHRSIGHLVIVLMPGSIAHPASWEAWMEELFATHLPERLRVLLVDSCENPRFSGLAERLGAQALTQQPPLDGFAVAEECFAQEGIGPAATFRSLTMGIATLLEKGSVEQIRPRVVEALAFARQQGWPDQQVALKLMMAGAFVKEARYPEAVQTYERARQDAEQDLAPDHPVARKLVLQTWFGQAGVHLAANQLPEAAHGYDQAAAVAVADNNALLGIEAWRMSAQTHAGIGDASASAERARNALQLAARLPAESRHMTTIGSTIAAQLARLDPERFAHMRAAKNALAEELEAIRRASGELAGQLVAAGAPDALEQVEARRTSAAEQAALKAAGALRSATAEASPEFQDWLGYGDRLLGSAWLVDDDLALPPLPASAANDTDPHGEASPS